MKAAELRASILQEAVSGKLVPQIASEGTADELLKQIEAERAALIKAGKLKKEKRLPEITEDEIPFDIPMSWRWVRLAEIISFTIGKTPERGREEYWKNGEIPWISISDIPDDGVITKTNEKITKDAFEKCFPKGYSTAGTLIMSFKLTIGKIGILSINAVHNEAIVSIYPIYDVKNIFRNYLKCVLPVSANNGDALSAIKGKTLNKNSISNLLIPLPPLSEQRRIVTKLEELLPLIDRYAEEEEKLSAISTQFPDAMRKSILQEAVSGKLVPQIASEGTADELLKQIESERAELIKAGKIKKEKPLPEITEEEIPFEIPKSWKWVRFGNVAEIARGGSPRPIDAYLTKADDGLNWIKIGDSDIGGKYIYQTKEKISRDGLSKTRYVKSGDFLLTNSMSFGRPYILKTDGCIHDGWLVIHFNKCLINEDYLYYLLSSPMVFQQFTDSVLGSVVKNLKTETVNQLMISLPPLSEQKRIVAKIEELMGIIDKIKA